MNDDNKTLKEMLVEIARRLEAIEKELAMLKSSMITTVTVTSEANDACSRYGHVYPNPWHATVPPPCSRCGLLADSMYITY